MLTWLASLGRETWIDLGHNQRFLVRTRTGGPKAMSKQVLELAINCGIVGKAVMNGMSEATTALVDAGRLQMGLICQAIPYWRLQWRVHVDDQPQTDHLGYTTSVYQ